MGRLLLPGGAGGPTRRPPPVTAAVLFAVLAVPLAARGRTRRPPRVPPIQPLFRPRTAACAGSLRQHRLLQPAPVSASADRPAYLAGFAAHDPHRHPCAGRRVDHRRRRSPNVRAADHRRARRNPHGCRRRTGREPTNGLALGVGLVAVIVGFGAWWTYSTSPDTATPDRTRQPPCSGSSATCRSPPRSPRCAPRWSASLTTPTTAAPQPPPRGDCPPGAAVVCAQPCW